MPSKTQICVTRILTFKCCNFLPKYPTVSVCFGRLRPTSVRFITIQVCFHALQVFNRRRYQDNYVARVRRLLPRKMKPVRMLHSLINQIPSDHYSWFNVGIFLARHDRFSVYIKMYWLPARIFLYIFMSSWNAFLSFTPSVCLSVSSYCN